MSLPQGIHNLTSLQELGIDNCPNLMSLPRGSRNLTFKKLEILDCPLLRQRCERQTGEDWPSLLMSHTCMWMV